MISLKIKQFLLKEAAERAGVQAELKKNYEVMMDLKWSVEEQPDFVVFLDKDILLAKFLKNKGIRIFNDPVVIETCDNKANQYIELSKHGIPMPKTIIAPKVYPSFTIAEFWILRKSAGYAWTTDDY